ncbi:hypothetical protein F5B21DRAFT_503098 [Xylaria acuta]|nr:hypothetical protein F5B21DRAFT_503098 [Xylaria acuta]
MPAGTTDNTDEAAACGSGAGLCAGTTVIVVVTPELREWRTRRRVGFLWIATVSSVGRQLVHPSDFDCALV